MRHKKMLCKDFAAGATIRVDEALMLIDEFIIGAVKLSEPDSDRARDQSVEYG